MDARLDAGARTSLEELGTGFAVSTAWMGLAADENARGHVWSIDGCSQLHNDFFDPKMGESHHVV